MISNDFKTFPSISNDWRKIPFDFARFRKSMIWFHRIRRHDDDDDDKKCSKIYINRIQNSVARNETILEHWRLGHRDWDNQRSKAVIELTPNSIMTNLVETIFNNYLWPYFILFILAAIPRPAWLHPWYTNRGLNKFSKLIRTVEFR